MKSQMQFNRYLINDFKENDSELDYIKRSLKYQKINEDFDELIYLKQIKEVAKNGIAENVIDEAKKAEPEFFDSPDSEKGSNNSLKKVMSKNISEFNMENIIRNKKFYNSNLKRFYTEKIKEIPQNLLKSPNKRISLNNNYCFIKSYEYAKVEKIKEEKMLNETLDLTGEVIYNDKYKFYFSKKIPLNNAKYLKLCYNNLKLPLHIRSKVDGDFIKLNLGNKKVSRIFIDSKVESNLRKYVPIITDNDNNILWVYDYAKSKEVFDSKENSDIYLVCEVL
jgi:tRNA(Ile)-lysidine synthase